MSEWISVEDRLPELKVMVLVFDDGGFGVLSGRLWWLVGILMAFLILALILHTGCQ